jgi:uncharacterized protein (DUF1697 family)
MPTYIALLRGINVGGNILKMERLREVCARLGAQNVRTYVQSGNVVFQATGSAPQWESKLEKKLAGESRLPPSVIVRTAGDISAVFAGNPFLREKGIDVKRLAVTFLQQAPDKTALDALAALKIAPERYHHAGKDIYLHCSNGFADSKLYMLDKVLKQRTTTRNWNTVTKLHEMAAEE